MNNDLISREALKNEIEKVSRFNDGTYKWLHLNGVYNAIDNAPTVETPCEQASEIIKAYTKGFNTGVEIVKNARLQGEWLFVSRNCWKCPYCQELTNEGKNFCPNCGAEMQKGGAK